MFYTDDNAESMKGTDMRIKHRMTRWICTSVLVFVSFPLFSAPANATSLWIERKGSPVSSWVAVAVSGDGNTLLAVNSYQICVSKNFGKTWNCVTPKDYVDGLSASLSADGSVAAVATASGSVLISRDSGVTWKSILVKNSATFVSVAMSGDGAKLTVLANGGHAYTSSDSGNSWTDRTPNSKRNWSSVAISKDGLIQYAAIYGGGILKSKNTGTSWTTLSRATSKYWKAIDCSADGKIVVAAVDGGGIYTSSDSGAHWTLQSAAPQYSWYSVAMSSDGKLLAAMADGADIYTSSDCGATWSASSSPGATTWSWIDVSSDGQRLVAGIKSGRVWTYGPITSPTAPTLSTAVAGAKSVAITFTAPVSDGDSAITGYEYTLNDAQSWLPLTTGSTPKSVTISNLVNGTNYAIRLRAVNEVGPGQASNSLAFTPRSVPDAPVITSVTLVSNRVRVSFAAPASDGGSPVTNYEYLITGTTTWAKIAVVNSNLSFDTKALKYGTTYTVTLRANNALGKSQNSSAKSILVATIPSAPGITKAVATHNKVVLTVTPPLSNGGAAISGYAYSVGTGEWVSAPLTRGVQTITITGLPANTTVSIRVRALNVMGQGAISLAKNLRTAT